MIEDLKNVFDKIEKAESIINELESKRVEHDVEPEESVALNKEHLDTIENARKTIASLREKLTKDLATKTLNLDKCQEDLSILQARLKVGQIDDTEYASKSKHLLDKIKSLEKKVLETQNLINSRFAEDIAPVIESEQAASVIKLLAEKKQSESTPPPSDDETIEKITEKEPVDLAVPGNIIEEQKEEIRQEIADDSLADQVTEIRFKEEEPAQTGKSPEESTEGKKELASDSPEIETEKETPLIDMLFGKDKPESDVEETGKVASTKVPSLKGHKPTLHLHRLNDSPPKKPYTSVGGAFRKNTVLVIVIAAFILGLLIWGAIAFLMPISGCNVGNMAPDFVMQVSENNTSSLSAFKGKNVILVFWDRDFWDSQFFYVNGTLRKLYTPEKLNQLLSENSSGDIEVIAIASGTSNNEVDKLINDYSVHFPVIVDSFGKLRESYHIFYEPTYIFLDKDGIIRARVEGPIINLSDLEQITYNVSKKTEIKPSKPPITDVIVQSITEKSATVNWSTTQPTTTQLDIDGKNIQTVLTPSPQTLHSMTLRDLEPAASYQVRIIYNVNNISVSEHSFTALSDTIVSKRYPVNTSSTDTSNPEISNISTGFITDSSVTVTWKTDEPTTGDVYYSIDTSFIDVSSQGSKKTIWHTVKIEGLNPDTQYFLKLSSKDAGGKEAHQEIEPIKTQNLIETAPKIGKRAPDFSLYSIDGVKFSLSQFIGRKVLLNFWLEGCPACESEMPILQTAFDKYTRDEFIILAVNVRGEPDKVSFFVAKENLTFPVVIDTTGDVDGIYRAPYFPISYFIDTKGIIREIADQSFHTVSQIDDSLSKLE
jgi:peroxiredoxin